MPRRNRKMKGGFLDSLTNSLTSGWDSLSNSASSGLNTLTSSAPTAYSKTKNAVTGTVNSVMSSTGLAQPQQSYAVGGRTRKHFKNKRGGGYSANTPLNGLAANAASVSNVKTAQPHNLVGGKKSKRSRKHKHSKSCKHNKR